MILAEDIGRFRRRMFGTMAIGVRLEIYQEGFMCNRTA